jgi:hypothetical protein
MEEEDIDEEETNSDAGGDGGAGAAQQHLGEGEYYQLVIQPRLSPYMFWL